MSRSLGAKSEGVQLPSAQDSLREKLTGVSNRVLIIGANSAGAYTLKAEFQRFLEEKGIQNPIVQKVGGPEFLEVAFFTGGLPRGVILLPWFRWHDSIGVGNTLSSHATGFDHEVEQLCSANGVPLIKAAHNFSNDDITTGIKQILGA